MIIKKIVFKNFKSFSSDVAKQNLDKLNILTLIYGDNNSGKSNILKFIDVLFKRKVELDEPMFVSGQTISRPNEISPFWKGKIKNDAFLFHNNERTLDIEFQVMLEFRTTEIKQLDNYEVLKGDLDINDKSFEILIQGDIKSLVDPYDSEISVRSVLLNGKKIYSYFEGAPIYFEGAKGTSLKNNSVSFENLMGLLNNCVLFLDHYRFLNNENEITSKTFLTPSNFKNWLHNLTLDPLSYSKYAKFIEFIKANSISGNSGKVLNNFEATYARKDDEIDIFLKNGDERFPIANFGTGIMQILLLLSMIFETNAKIVLIEELELNLSPKSQQELLAILGKLIQSQMIDQVIFTSHSDTLINTKGLSVYEVLLSDTGVSEVSHKATPTPAFFNRNAQIDIQIDALTRNYGTGNKAKPDGWD